MNCDDKRRYEQIAMAMLAKRECSAFQVNENLLNKGASEALSESLVSELIEQNAINDERFTQVYVRSYFRKGQGPVKIRNGLAQAGIDSDLATTELASENFDWFENAREVRERKFGATIPSEFKEKAKQMRFLYSRGFSNEQIEFALQKFDT